MLDTTTKARVDSFVRRAASDKLSRLTASHVATALAVDVAQVRERLFQLHRDDQIVVTYEIECPNADCARSFRSYKDLKDVPLGQQLSCQHCDTQFVLSPENIWVTFTPNPAYFLDAEPPQKKTP